MKKQMQFIVIALVVVVMTALALPALAEFSPDEDGVMIGPDAILYRDDGAIEIWAPDADDNWNPVIRLSADDAADYEDAPETNTLVEQAGTVALYKLTSGEWQVNSGPDAEGKVQVVVFDEGFAYEHQYEWNTFDSE
jgi:hypothetical protein